MGEVPGSVPGCPGVLSVPTIPTGLHPQPPKWWLPKTVWWPFMKHTGDPSELTECPLRASVTGPPRGQVRYDSKKLGLFLGEWNRETEAEGCTQWLSSQEQMVMAGVRVRGSPGKTRKARTPPPGWPFLPRDNTQASAAFRAQ